MRPGALWYGMLLGLAGRLRHAGAAVSIGALRRGLELHYHGLGGALARRVEGAGRYARIAGAEQAQLPGWIDRYAQRTLNEELYFWLGAFLACDRPLAGEKALHAGVRHLLRGAATSARVLREFPGLGDRYRRLCAAELELRAVALPGWDAAARHPVVVLEAAFRHALGDARAPRDPWLALALEAARRDAPLPPAPAAPWLPYLPVPLWGHEGATAWRPRLLPFRRRMRRRAEGAVKPLSRPRPEALHTGPAEGPPARGTCVYAEWDYRRRAYRADWCSVIEQAPEDARRASFGAANAARALQLRAQFEALRQQPAWSRPRESGDELDLGAYVDSVADARGCGRRGAQLYRQRARRRGELAVALLLDRSRSTEAWVGDRRVIGLGRDAMLALAEALAAAGDEFGLFAFASDSRLRVRCDRIKGFDEAYDAASRSRMLAVRAGNYTRMGAAVRHVAAQLEPRPAPHKFLLVLTDGRPYDPADGYEDRYGIEDTHRALLEARWHGLHCFGLAIGERGGEHLARLFGAGHYAVLSEPGMLPQVLPRLYARLTLGPQ